MLSLTSIILIIITLYFIFLFVPPLDKGWDSCSDPYDSKEGFCIPRRKLVSRNMTTMQCQNHCLQRQRNGMPCRYTHVPKNTDPGNRGLCYVSRGFGKQQGSPGCNNMRLWENKKFAAKNVVKARNLGADPYRRWYVRSWWTRHRWCWGWWRWRRCGYGWWHRHWRWYYNRRYLRRKMRKGEGDCDRNSDCAGRLKCFQRGRYSIPGVNVRGMPRSYDFCYDPADRKVLNG
mgnify:CR=1 FL=1